MQTTIRSAISFQGVGLHTGRPSRVTLRPAAAEHGIWFRRTDIRDRNAVISARWDSVADAELCTRIVNSGGVSVSTIEHLMAAVAGTGLCNLLIEIDGPEVPILDGSAAPFVSGILSRGVQTQDAPVRAIEVLRPVRVTRGDAIAQLDPSDGLQVSFEIDFAEPAIGRQAKVLDMANGTFVHELCDSRTFCRNSDVAAMRARGLARGGSLMNAVVVEGGRILTPGGLRYRDEAVRHKMLDALGDLSLAGAPLLARYTGIRAGHALTNLLLRALFADPSAYRLVACNASQVRRLPGAGLTRNDAPLLAA